MSEVEVLKSRASNLQRKVFSGDFPKKSLSKMSRKTLERFVLRLVESTSGIPAAEAQDFEGLCRMLFLNEVDKPQWWPSDHIISRTLTPDGKFLMELLKFVVYRCCEFFKKHREDLNSEVFVTETDENFRRSKRKRVAEITTEACVDSGPPAKRRTLLPKNCNANLDTSKELILSHIKSPVVKLQDVFYKPKPLDQDGFLKLFDLQNISMPAIENVSSSPLTSGSSIKFNMSLHIPFSSDLGLELMKRDNHTCPETTKSRKLERLEWYLNKAATNPNVSHPVTYQERKDTTFHVYKFPRRQYYQQPGNGNYHLEDVHRRYLTVSLARNNLEQLQTAFQTQLRAKLQVVLSRLNKNEQNSTGQMSM